MRPLKIPAFLHDVFGERQSLLSILSILLFGGLLTAALYAAYPQLADSLPIWRTALALLLMFDVFAGCIANFTLSTSNFYAARPKNRLVFIAIHFHIILIALLLGTSIASVIGIWAYTIAGTLIVNALHGRQMQPFAAGFLLSAGLGIMPLLPDLPPYMLVTSLLFMLKVLFSFGVDHYGKDSRSTTTRKTP